MDKGREEIIVWAQALEAYARDWDETFERRPSYFTQEFWYLLVNCMIASWRGQPMTMSQACQAMKSGSNRTREERIKRAVDDGYLVKERAGNDGRSTLIMPTEKLESIMTGHLSRTREIILKALNHAG